MSEQSLHIKQLGRYDIVRVLGQGAMGVVYEGRDPHLDRRVAIKTVRVTGMGAAEIADYENRFKTEARSAGRLQHPNIVSVYDAGNHTGAFGQTAYIVMEFVEGQDLKHFLDQGHRFSLEQTTNMLCDLLSALDYAHRNKIIHRDIKPANMLLTKEGRIKLTDFGVARITDTGEATRTQAGTVGTLKYMSPEQVAGKGVDSSSDLFSTGIVLYQLLTGARPFDGEGYLDIISKIVKEDPKPPSQIVGALPPALDTVVAKALAKSKLDRYADATSFSRALRAAVDQADPTTMPSDLRSADGTGSGTQSGTQTGSHISTHAGTYSGTQPGTYPGSFSGTSPTSGTNGTGGTGSGGSIVAQELELVYWKDVKDSQDPEVLEGFLRRFPLGIYADLAKRRLKSLTGADATAFVPRYESTASDLSSPGQSKFEATSPSMIGLPSSATSPDRSIGADAVDADATTVFLRPTVASAAQPATPVEAVAQPSADFSTPPKPLSQQATPQPSEPDYPPIEQLQRPAAKKSSAVWGIGIAAISLLAAGAWFMLKPAPRADLSAASANTASYTVTETLSGSSSADPAISSTTASLPAYTPSTSGLATSLNTTSVAMAVTSTASAPARAASAASAPKLAASAAALAASAASAPRRGASAPGITTTTALPPIATTVPVTPPATPAASAAGDSSDAAKQAASSDPREICKNRSNFRLRSCLKEQCEKPASRNMQVCVDLRDQEERGLLNNSN
jgi:eukaryotic-like serine/threonine-protein kinase